VNNTISGNNDGIRTYGSPVPVIANNIITYNTAFGLWNRGHPAYGTSHLETKHNDIYGNGADYGEDGGALWVSRTAINDISAPPQFADTTGGDYHLLSSSPCIDTGDNTSVPTLLATDFEGDIRFIAGKVYGNLVVDIGADEFVPTDNTLVGTNVTVSFPAQGVEVTFSEVISSGNTGYFFR
jgi:parallel beta-helix repeat protein